MQKQLIIFVGLQASGKSTFYRTYFASTHLLVSKDCFRNNKNPGRRQRQLIEAGLKQERSLVVDNTNPTLEDRAAIIELGRLYNAEIIGYYFQSQVESCLERNQQREGKAKVPDVAIYATIKKLVPPTYAEGFDRLFYVSMGENNSFKISHLSP